MHDSNEWNELRAVIFDKENIAITNFEFGSIGHLHCLGANRPTQEVQSDFGTGIALDSVVYLKCDVASDMALSSFSGPFRAHICNRSLEDHLCAAHEIIERWRNHSSGESHGHESESGSSK